MNVGLVLSGGALKVLHILASGLMNKMKIISWKQRDFMIKKT